MYFAFTFWITLVLIQVLNVSHPAVLEVSSRSAKEIDRFFTEHTHIDVSYIEPHDRKFLNLTIDWRVEIAFAGRPRRFKVPNYKIYKYEHSERIAVVFEVETRLIQRYIPILCDFDVLEIEQTDYLPLTGCARQVTDMRASYMNA